MSKQPAVDLLAFQVRAAGLAKPEREFQFAKPRRWRFDLAWPNETRDFKTWYGVAVEVDGGTWIPGGGRHNRGAGFEKDCEKLNTAALMGWRVLRFTPKHVKSGEALAVIEQILKA